MELHGSRFQSANTVYSKADAKNPKETEQSNPSMAYALTWNEKTILIETN